MSASLFQSPPVIAAPVRILSLDPSAVSTGWAVMEPGKIIASGTWHPSEAKGCDDRYDQLADFVYSTVKKHAVPLAIVEVPAGGQRHSATQLMVYARAVGVCECAPRLAGARVERVKVTEWKGNSRKGSTAVMACLRYKIHEQGRTHNELDAIGIGDAWLGHLRHYRKAGAR